MDLLKTLGAPLCVIFVIVVLFIQTTLNYSVQEKPGAYNIVNKSGYWAMLVIAFILSTVLLLIVVITSNDKSNEKPIAIIGLIGALMAFSVMLYQIYAITKVFPDASATKSPLNTKILFTISPIFNFIIMIILLTYGYHVLMSNTRR